MPDPALQIVIDELNTVLQKHDVGAFVILNSPRYSHYLHHLTTTWSCLRMEGDMLRVRSKRADYPTSEAQTKVLTATVSMLAGFIDCSRQEADKLEGLLKMIGQTVEIEHVTRSEDPKPQMNDAAKARAFEVLVHHIAQVMPPEVAIQQLAGVPMVEALKDFVFVPKADWERLNHG